MRHRQPPLWLAAGALAMGGIVLGATVTDVPRPAVLGGIALLLAVGAVLYRAALGLAVLAFFYPWDLTTRAGPVKLTTSAALLGILALVWVMRQVIRNSQQSRKTPLDVPVLLFAGVTVLSLQSIFGPGGDPDAELVGLLKATGGFLVFFLAVQSIDERRDLWLVLGAVLASGLVQAVATIVPILSGTQLVSAASRPSGTMIHANLFAGYLLLIIPLVLAVAVGLPQRWILPLAGAATAVYGAALVATLSRSGLVGLIAAALALALLLPEKRKQVALLAGALLLASLLAGLVGPMADRIATAEENVMTIDGRLEIWGRALQVFANHFLFGVGVGNFGNFVSWRSLSHAHSLYLNIAAERGILGLATFSMLIVALFRTLARAFRNALGTTYRVLTAGLIASFVAFLTHSLFDATYYDYKILLLFWLLVGVAATLPRLFSEQRNVLGMADRAQLG